MLVWILAGLAVAIVPFILVGLNVQRKYRPLFDDTHLVELAEILARLKVAAAAGSVCSEISAHDLAVSWDATKPELALSHRDGKLHRAAGAFLAHYALAVIAPPEGTTTQLSQAHGRYLLRLTLPPGSDADFRVAPVAVPSSERLAALRAQAADAIRGTRFDSA